MRRVALLLAILALGASALAGRAADGPAAGATAGLGSALAALRAPAGAAAASEVRLLDGWHAGGGSHVAAIEIRLAPGWHTYWRLPGDVGIPPVMDWSGSRNLAAVAYDWPRPRLFERDGLQSFGYADSLTLPVRLTAADPRLPVEARLRVSFGVCREICASAEASVAVDLAPERPAQDRARIAAAQADDALGPAAAGVRGVTCGLVAGASGPELAVEVDFAAPLELPQGVALETAGQGLRLGKPSVSTEGGLVTARSRVAGAAAFDRSRLRVTVVDATRAVEIRGCEPR